MAARTKRLVVLAALVLGVGSVAAIASRQQAEDHDVTVRVTYKGKGTVDATHGILVFLFPSPQVDAGSEPIAKQLVERNGGSAKFTNVTTNPVYVVAVYNEGANYDGTAGPPPDGTPFGSYRLDPKGPLSPVEPGSKGAITLTFDDSRRFTR